MSSILTVISIKSGRRRVIFAEADACFGYSCIERILKPYSNEKIFAVWTLDHIFASPHLVFLLLLGTRRKRLGKLPPHMNCYARRVRHTLCAQLVALTRCVKESMCAQELAQGVPWSIHSRVSVMNLS
jgi:hypothetical protein